MSSSDASRGVIVGADKTIEWLLPWWWKHYSRYNELPVVFFDFGMSGEKKKWCKERGSLVDLSSHSMPVAAKEGVGAKFAEEWEKRYAPEVWTSRKAWFKKPLACLNAPFDLSLWLDLDCEVCGPLDEVFAALPPTMEIGMVRDISAPESLFNSGVVVFRKNGKVLHDWLAACRGQNGKFLGDQEVFSHLAGQGKIAVCELLHFYNWRMAFGFHPSALIVHWVGVWGKEYIRTFGGIHSLMQHSKRR